MTEPRSRFVSINGLRLHYLEWGGSEGPPLLLLHGGSAHAHWWDFFVAGLPGSPHVIALDLRGHGDSEWSEPPRYDLCTHAADVSALIEALALHEVVLVGHSFGGMIAIECAAAPGQALAALVIVDSRARISERGARFMSGLRAQPHPIFASPEEAVERFRLLPKQHAASSEVIRHVTLHGIRRCTGGWTLKFDRRAMGDADQRDLVASLARVRCPTLIVRGAQSEVISSAALAQLAAAAPHARTAEIPAAHHHVMLERPQDLAAAVAEFLRRIRGQDS